MSPRAARFLARLYPPAWRARFGGEFQTFLESRHVSLLEAINIAGRALIERVAEGWRVALLVTAFIGIPMFAACCAVYLGAGKAAANPAPWFGWGAVEAAAVAACVWMKEPLWPAVRGELGSWQFRGRAAVTLPASALFLFFGAPWHVVAGMAILDAGSLGRGIARQLTGERLSFLLAASIVTATLTSLGWGLFFRRLPMEAIWWFAFFPIFDVAEMAKSARRIFVGH